MNIGSRQLGSRAITGTGVSQATGSAATSLNAVPIPTGGGATSPSRTSQAVLACLDHVETDARRIGAVNIVVPRDGGLTGCNSDVNGIATALQGIDLEGSTVVMIGAGGAARAAAAYLGDCGVRRLTILVRGSSKSRRAPNARS